MRPLILSPCGSFEALKSAVNAGADEVYFGLKEFNARNSATNFDDSELKEALRMCRILGVKTNITLNTLVTDREMPKALNMVYDAASLGADAFIVQDLGLAREIKRQMPSVHLHASTQCACHSVDGAKKLYEMGFERIVLARELDEMAIKQISSLGFETEMFVHGALCVCHSGMCLMSSVIGERSGNRGLCAQPCRLPYSIDDGVSGYPLSLKDMSLAEDIQKIIDTGVTSLKIEGRMKAPEYVYGVTKIYKTLVTSGRDASKEEMARLSDLFSRQGFTNKYFTGEYKFDNADMYGVRTAQDKKNTFENKGIDSQALQRKRNIKMSAFFTEGQNATLCLECDDKRIECVSDFVCQTSKTRPASENDIKESLMKLGDTFFSCSENDIKIEINGDIFLPKSSLNAFRRNAVATLEEKLCGIEKIQRIDVQSEFSHNKEGTPEKSIHICARNMDGLSKIKECQNVKFVSVPLECFENAKKEDFDVVFENNITLGIKMPRVLFDMEKENANKLIEKAKSLGAEFAYVSNIGQIDMCKNKGLRLFGAHGLNVYNSYTLKKLSEEGFESLCMSPELKYAQMRDLYRQESVRCEVFAKGHLDLMVTESCFVRANGKCKHNNLDECACLCDRKNYKFKVGGEKRLTDKFTGCRCIIYNSVENTLINKKEELLKTGADVCLVLV